MTAEVTRFFGAKDEPGQYHLTGSDIWVRRYIRRIVIAFAFLGALALLGFFRQ